MNRIAMGSLGAALALTVPVGAALAQVPFKVSRPQDGARVRETVRIQMPRTALQGIKYLSLSVDGKFRAGVAIPEERSDKNGKNLATKTDLLYSDDKVVAILWNTKALVANPTEPGVLEAVEDGPHTIDLIAFDAGNKRVGKDTLTLEVDNKGGLRVPADGILLAYHFAVGEEVNYRQKTDLEFLGERKAPDPNTLLNSGGNGFASAGRGQGFGAQGGMPMGMPGGMGGGSSSMMGGRGPGGMPGMGSSGMGGRRGPGGMPGMPGGMGGGSSSMMGGRGPGGMPGMQGGSSSMMGGGRFGGRGMMGGAPPGGGPMFGSGGPGAGAYEATGPFTIPVQTVRANYERSTEDRVSGAAFFLRDKVKDGTIISGNGSAARLQDVYDFKSRYRTIATSGAVLDPGVANMAHPGAYVALPMVDLGGARRRIGQTWITQSPLLLEWATLDAPPMVRATNVLESLEWQNGFQTARIKQTFEGRADVPIYGGLGTIKGAKVTMDRVIWFGFKAGRIIRMETTTQVEGEAPADILAAMVPQAGIGGGGMMMGGGMPMGSSGMMGSMGGRFGGGGNDDLPGAGGVGGGFGGLQSGGQQEAPTAPAKFKSTTVIELVPKPITARTASLQTLPKPGTR